MLLIRNPYDAMVSEWNRRESKGQDTTNSHVGSSNQDRFGKYMCVCTIGRGGDQEYVYIQLHHLFICTSLYVCLSVCCLPACLPVCLSV